MNLRGALLANAMAATLATAGTASGGDRTAPPVPHRPNLVVFLADDLGGLDTGAYGNREVKTPNIDRLARDGIAFDRAFVASPACAPSRAALLTGLMPARNGAEANGAAPKRWVRTLPSYLHDLGYEVVAFGKVAHYKQVGQYGFDHAEHDSFHDDAGPDAAVAWLEARHDPRPLALFVGSNWPHVPWPPTTEGYDPRRVTLPAKSIDTPITRDARARYYAAITRLDAELGKVIAASDRLLGKESVVLFSSDHGAQWPFAKWNLYDSGIRVPLVVRWSGKVRPATRNAAMVSWVDILPTLVNLAGGDAPPDLDGRSFAPALRGDTTAGRTEIFTTHTNDGDVNVFPMRSIRSERFKYIRSEHPDWTYTTHVDLWVDRLDSGPYFPSWRQAARSDPMAKAVVDRYYCRAREELYDLAADPDESTNLAQDPRYAEVVGTMRRHLDAWQVEQGDTVRLRAVPHLAPGPVKGLPKP